jgi:hypothetical protein
LESLDLSLSLQVDFLEQHLSFLSFSAAHPFLSFTVELSLLCAGETFVSKKKANRVKTNIFL